MRRNERGDINLVVVAIALPIFFLVVAGIIDLARVPLAQQTLLNALSFAATNLIPNWCPLPSELEPSSEESSSLDTLEIECMPLPTVNDGAGIWDPLAPRQRFGIEPFFPAAHLVSGYGSSHPPTGALPPPSVEIRNNSGGGDCSALNAPSAESTFLCVDELVSTDPIGTSMPDLLSAKAAALALNQLSSGSGFFKFKDVAFSIGFYRVEVDSSGKIAEGGSDQFTPIGYPFEASFIPDLNWEALRDMLALQNGSPEIGAKKIILELVRHFNSISPTPPPIGWKTEGICMNGDSGPAGVCPAQLDNAYFPPVFLVLYGVIRLQSVFGTFALLGGSNERYVVQYYVLPLQNLYGFGDRYWGDSGAGP